MNNNSRRTFIKLSSISLAAAIIPRVYGASTTITVCSVESKIKVIILEEWYKTHDVAPQQYLSKRLQSNCTVKSHEFHITEDFKNRNIYFVGGLAMSEFEFAKLAEKL
jgi:hypothetical protein